MSGFNQENDLWQALLVQTDPKKQAFQCVEMAHLLLEKAAELQHNAYASMNKEDLTELMIDYQLVGQQIEGFLAQALPHIDPEYQGEPFELQLKTLQAHLIKTKTTIERIIQQKNQLTLKKDELMGEIEHLTPIKQQADQLQQIVDQLQQQLAQLLPETQRLQDLKVEADSIQLHSIQSILQPITAIVALLKQCQTIYQWHFKENADIERAMLNDGDIVVLGDYTKELNTLSRDIGMQLQRFDETLKALLLLNEQQLQHLKIARGVA